MRTYLRRRLQFLCVLISAILALFTSAGAKPIFGFSFTNNFPVLPSFSQFGRQFLDKRASYQMKTYSGIRQRNDSLIMIYHHDRTVAVVELLQDKVLVGCELIEIYQENYGKELLKKLSSINLPFEVTFKEMLKLMKQCEMVDKMNESRNKWAVIHTQAQQEAIRGILSTNPISLLSGIIPGTKWCGTGDIAATFSDLGTERKMDRCCRMHDLCPKKIRAYQNRYELENNSIYTKSHCICDDMLFSCLKNANTSAAQLMGSIYFNLIQVPCIEETYGRFHFQGARKGF